MSLKDHFFFFIFKNMLKLKLHIKILGGENGK
jgi:hypothetical protein